MATLSKANPFTYISDSGPERFAVRRVNLLLAKIFAIGGLAVGLQMLLNAWSQKDLLDPWYFWISFLSVGIGQIGLIIGAFVSGEYVFWQRWYALAIAGSIMLWFLGTPSGAVLPEGFYPWPWWGVGLAAVAAFAGLPPLPAIIFFTVLDTYWFVARFFPAYGAVDVWLNLQDTLLTFLFAALLGSLIFVSRYEASKVDEASERKIAAAADQARADASVREKSRLDALIHDKVLTTLLLASKAQTDVERESVAKLAIAAITNLNEAQRGADAGPISCASFFAALETMANSQDGKLTVSSSDVGTLEIPAEVATAFAEATLQAIVNSQQHAGHSASRELHLKANANGMKVVIKDDGRGFRMSRVPKNRLGVRISIIERVEMVGGRAFIDSRPGSGATIILEWGNHA